MGGVTRVTHLTKFRRAGLTLLELMVVVVLISTMVGGAAIYYTQIIEQRREGKAQTEMIRLAEGIKAYEKRTGQPVGAQVTVGGQARPFTLQELVWSQVMVEIPPDPWSTDYEVNTTAGFLLCIGPDRTPDTRDDIRHFFKPPFDADRALFDPRAKLVRVHFSRELDHTSVTSSTISIVGAGEIEVAKVAVPMDNRYETQIRLKGAPDVTAGQVVIAPTVKARDGRLMLEERRIPITAQ